MTNPFHWEICPESDWVSDWRPDGEPLWVSILQSGTTTLPLADQSPPTQQRDTTNHLNQWIANCHAAKVLSEKFVQSCTSIIKCRPNLQVLKKNHRAGKLRALNFRKEKPLMRILKLFDQAWLYSCHRSQRGTENEATCCPLCLYNAWKLKKI